MGLADENLQRREEPINQAFDRWKKETDVNVARQRTDLPEAQARNEWEKEQERRLRSADMATQRGDREYNRLQATQAFNPSLT